MHLRETFNDQIMLDFWHATVHNSGWTILTILDTATSYIMLTLVPTQATKDVTTALSGGWLRAFGPRSRSTPTATEHG